MLRSKNTEEILIKTMTEKMSEKTVIHSHHVAYEKDAYEGVCYLKIDLDSKEAEVFFREARMRGSANFEDDKDRQFTLVYKDGIYNLIRR